MRKLALMLTSLSTLMLFGCGSNAATSSPPAQNNTKMTSKPAAPKLKQQNVALTVLPGGRLGPDGKMHDTFTTPNFTVVAGVPVKLSVYNYDSGKHSVTSGALHLNLVAKGSTKNGVPAITTATFTPGKAGKYIWQCMEPCDGQNGGWSMTHLGYMRGTINVVPYANKQYIYMMIKDSLHYATADKKIHDSYSPTSFIVQANIPVQATVENFDTGQHSFTDPGLNINRVFRGGKKVGDPSLTTFTFTPKKAGTYSWRCIIPCDGQNKGWAMNHNGYMMGSVKVTP